MKISDIVMVFGEGNYKGDIKKEVEGTCSLENPKRRSILFCRKGYGHMLKGVRDCLVILDRDDVSFLDTSNACIISNNPRLTFARIARRFFGGSSLVSVTSDPEPEGVIVGNFVHFEGFVRIGKRVQIQPHVTIGTAGFGYERNEEGEWEYFPQVGGVVIGDDVDIGSKTNIQRGALDNTSIGRGSKIGPGCNIGHNSIIGKHTFIAGMTNLGGKAKIGDYCFIGMGVIILPGIEVGNNVMIGAGAVVTKNVPNGVVACGVPAKIISKNLTKYGN